MFKIPDTYNDDTFLKSTYNNLKWIDYYTLQIEIISEENSSELCNYYRSRASHLFRQKKYLDSINDLLESNKLSYNDDNLVSLSFCYEKIGDLKKSVELLKKFNKLHLDEIYITDYIKNLSQKIISNNLNNLNVEFSKLRTYLTDNNCNLDNISIKYNRKVYREIISTDKISKGDTVLEISKDCIIISEMGRNTEIGKEVIDKKLSLISKHNWITFVLLEILKKKSKWKSWESYLNILPMSFDFIPIFFKKQYLEYLTGSQCVHKICQRRLLILKDYETLSKYINEMKKYTYGEYIWARTVVITRIFGIVVDGIKTQALVPFADMLNHTQSPKTRWYFDDVKKVFKIVSKETLSKDETIYDSYGRKCNSRFFVNYGFVLDNNIDNLALFEFDLSNSYIQCLKKKKWYKFKKVPSNYSIGIINNNNEKLNMFMAISRYYVCNDDEYFGKSLTPFLYPISLSNEKKTLKYIMYLCINHLKKYSRSKSDDLKILLDPLNKYNCLYSKMRDSIIICYGEKYIYEYYLRMCIEGLRILNLNFEKLIETNLLIDGLSGKYREYIHEHICKILNKNGDLDYYLNDI